MSMIFPGMDPYLEAPDLWPGMHASFIVYLRDHLQPRLRPRYLAAIEERVFVEGPDREIIPDVWVRRHHPRSAEGAAMARLEGDEPVLVEVAPLEVHETYLTILDRRSGQRLVTVIEVVSPSNKYAGPGRESYRAQQREVLQSQAHLVEIDLLRLGPHVLAVPEWAARNRAAYDYLICVHRALGQREKYELYFGHLRQRLPRVRLPLADQDPEVVADLQAVLVQVYEAGSYGERVNYTLPCVPFLSAAEQAWADQHLQQARKTV
ncbi:MAG: DUF4058 family protein [Candidatus Tectimicrobiota bacterium]